MTKQTQKFIKGAVVLSFAGLISKIASAFFNIPLAYFTGDHGFGLYQQVYPIYSILTAAALVGIPNSVSKLIAEEVAAGEYKKAHDTFKSTFLITSLSSVFVTLFLMFGGNLLIDLVHWEPGSVYVMYGLALAPVFIAVSGAIRGYFQGMQIMHPTGISQIIENTIKFIVGIFLVVLFLKLGYDIPQVVGGAAIGATIGLGFSATYLGYEYLKRRKEILKRVETSQDAHEHFTYKVVVQKVLKIAIPVTIASAAFSIMNLVDSFTMSSIFMNHGKTTKEAVQILGQMRKAFSVISVPLVLSVSLITNLVPSISSANARKEENELRHKIKEGIGLAVKLGTPAGVGMAVLALPIMKLLYPGGYDGAIYLQLFGAALVFMVMGQSMAGILQGLSKYYAPLISLFLATIVKIVLNYLLIPSSFGVGAAVSSVVYYVIFVGLNLYFIRKNVNFHFSLKTILIKPMISAVVMGTAAILSYKGSLVILHSNALATLIAITIGVVVYGVTLFMIKGLTEDEISLLPKGEFLMKIFAKYHRLEDEE